MERKTTIARNKEGYGYKYTELAEINKYCENNNISYYQEVDTCDINGKDYIVTYVTENGVTTSHRGCQIVDAVLQGIKNPVQEYGSSLTYCRRYSLLMALGLSTDDDDGASCGTTQEVTEEEAKKYKFGEKTKHPNATILEVFKDDKGYLQWCLDNGKNARIKEMITLLTGLKPTEIPTDEEQHEMFEYLAKFDKVTDKQREAIYKKYNVKSNTELTLQQFREIFS
ncbi:MAG: ERF family protein [Bacilli bacterium]|nr:ERF family protein [Bacilli bacterium]